MLKGYETVHRGLKLAQGQRKTFCAMPRLPAPNHFGTGVWDTGIVKNSHVLAGNLHLNPLGLAATNTPNFTNITASTAIPKPVATAGLNFWRGVRRPLHDRLIDFSGGGIQNIIYDLAGRRWRRRNVNTLGAIP
jgi:hypothetical protein